MLSGVRAQIAIKVFGEDLDTLRSQAGLLRERLAKIPGMADLEIEKQVLAPQIKVRVDFDAAARYGISTAQLTRSLQTLVDGEVVTQIVEGNRRFDLVVRLPDGALAGGLANLLIETPSGRVPLSRWPASRTPTARTRSPATKGGGASSSRPTCRARAVRRRRRHAPGGGRIPAARGLFHHPGRPVPGAGRSGPADRRAGARLAALMFMVLYSRYRSALLAGLIMANIPLALVGACSACGCPASRCRSRR
jgi:HME family heavy-metal exporter